MKIDLTNLITNVVDSININENVIIPNELIEVTSIRKLENVVFHETEGENFQRYWIKL